MSSPTTSRPDGPVKTQNSAWIPLLISGLLIGAAFIAVYVGLQRDPLPHRLPIAVVGAQLASGARSGLGQAVDVTEVTTLDDATALVRSGTVVAAAAVTPSGTLQVEYAGASGFSESGAARQLLSGLAAHAGLSLDQTDVVPLAKEDSRGLSAFYVVFGVTLSSFVLAQGLTGATASVRLRHRLYVMTGFAILIGATAATIAGPVYGSLTAPFPVLAVSLALLSAASAFATKALGAWLGPAGIALAVLVLTTVGNATSGATIGYDLLPGWAQALSDKLPPGAAVRAISDYGYFNGSGAAGPLATLALWFLAGLALVLLHQSVGTRRRDAGLGAVAKPADGESESEAGVSPASR